MDDCGFFLSVRIGFEGIVEGRERQKMFLSFPKNMIIQRDKEPVLIDLHILNVLIM